MNRFSKHLSLIVIVLSLVTHANTYGMLTNKLTNKQLLSFNPTTKRTYRVPIDYEKTKKLQKKLHHDIQCAKLTLLNYLIDQDSLAVEKHDCIKSRLFIREQLEREIDMALDLAAKEILNPHAKVRIATLKLLHTLVNVDEEDHTFKIAARAAETTFTSKNPAVKKEAFNLVEILIYKGKALETAKRIVDIAMMSKNKREKRAAIKFSHRIARYNTSDETRS